MRAIEQIADRLGHQTVLGVVLGPRVVGLAWFALLQEQVQGSGVVLHKEPIALLAAIAVKRQRLAQEGVDCKERHRLLLVLARADAPDLPEDGRVGPPRALMVRLI